MRKITIDQKIIQLAENYQKELLYTYPTKDRVSRSTMELEKLKDRITKKELCLAKGDPKPLSEYIDKMIRHYQFLLVAQPRHYKKIIGFFEKTIQADDISSLTLKSPKGNLLFYEEIVRCMRYDYVQRKVFPSYIRALSLKTCVYCNSQHAITTKNNITTYELDHCWPKSKHPYLCTNFFNLQPCCGCCNKHKSSTTFETKHYNLSIWKTPNDKDDKLFGYKINDNSLAQFLLDHKQESLSIEFDKTQTGDAEYESLIEAIKQKLHIEELYKEHKDIAEEVVWKATSYSPSYLASLRKAFAQKYDETPENWARLLLGTYTSTNESYKRPLAELIQDIARQLHIPL